MAATFYDHTHTTLLHIPTYGITCTRRIWRYEGFSVTPTSRENLGVLNSAVCAVSIVLLTRRSNGIDQHCKPLSSAARVGNRVEYGHHTGVHETKRRN